MTDKTAWRDDPLVKERWVVLTDHRIRALEFEGLTVLVPEGRKLLGVMHDLQRMASAIMEDVLVWRENRGKAAADLLVGANEKNGRTPDLKPATKPLKARKDSTGKKLGRRQAPKRKVTARNRSPIEKLECGHSFRRPSGHSRETKARRCMDCLAAAV